MWVTDSPNGFNTKIHNTQRFTSAMLSGSQRQLEFIVARSQRSSHKGSLTRNFSVSTSHQDEHTSRHFSLPFTPVTCTVLSIPSSIAAWRPCVDTDPVSFKSTLQCKSLFLASPRAKTRGRSCVWRRSPQPLLGCNAPYVHEAIRFFPRPPFAGVLHPFDNAKCEPGQIPASAQHWWPTTRRDIGRV